jgi:hypothetical protein
MNWSFLKGLRTVAVGLALAIVPQATAYLFSVDWTHVAGISPNAATIIGVVMIGLRAVTTTAIGKAA